MSRPTIYDVAEAAGVSIKTVSRVINGEPNVRPGTVSKVTAAITALNYHPSSAARGLSRGKLPTIGVIVDSFTDPFFGELIEVVERSAHQAGMDVLVAATGADATRMREQVQRLTRRGVSGLILAPVGPDGSVTDVLPDVPLVVIDRKCGIEGRDIVRVDDTVGAHNAVRHLIAHGHRRIAFVGSIANFTTVADRFTGYQKALAEAGIAVDPSLHLTDVSDPADAARRVRELLSGPGSPTAIFVTSPGLGAAVLQVQRANGRSDVALVTFGDFPLAALMTPPTTVIDQGANALGDNAFALLMRRIADPGAAVEDRVLATRLVPRGSGELAPPAARA